MKKYLNGLAILSASAWVGGIWVIGYVAAPVLFQTLQDKALAGMLAGKLFAATAYLGLVCGAYLLVYCYTIFGMRVRHKAIFWVIFAMLLLLLLGHFGIQPLLAELKELALPHYVMESAYADRFRFWHGAASIVFLLQSVLGGVLLMKIYGQQRDTLK